VGLPRPPASAAAGAIRRAPLSERPVAVTGVRARPPVPPGRGAPLLAGLLLAATLGAWLSVVAGWPHSRSKEAYGK
jgi:ABC-type branched-subunit amino acid transport system permease subunit